MSKPDYTLAYTAVISRACAAYAFLKCGEPGSAKDALSEVMEIMRMVEGRPILIITDGSGDSKCA